MAVSHSQAAFQPAKDSLDRLFIPLWLLGNSCAKKGSQRQQPSIRHRPIKGRRQQRRLMDDAIIQNRYGGSRIQC
ncbi:MAG: hypothetical protein ACFBSG_12870 [Leptolyngbyaceae cyanobacterium]